MEDEDCPDLVPIGAEQSDGSPGGKIPVTIITGYLGERGAGAVHGGDCREGPGGLRGGGRLHTGRGSSSGRSGGFPGPLRAAPGAGFTSLLPAFRSGLRGGSLPVNSQNKAARLAQLNLAQFSD